jgi:hypothetical protein
MASGEDNVGREANSSASLRIAAASVVAQRMSICTLRPMIHPDSASACWNAPMRACQTGSFAAAGTSTPMRRTRSPCCARATTGHAAAPLRSVMKSRRFTA